MQWRGREKKGRFGANMGLFGVSRSEKGTSGRKLPAQNIPLLFSAYTASRNKTGRVAATLENILILRKLVGKKLPVSKCWLVRK